MDLRDWYEDFPKSKFASEETSRSQRSLLIKVAAWYLRQFPIIRSTP
jgi:hypothetical protein